MFRSSYMTYNHFSYRSLNLFFFYLQPNVEISVQEKEICNHPPDMTFPVLVKQIFITNFLLHL